MPRKPQPPRLVLGPSGHWEIRWQDGRSRRASTWTADRREAEKVFAAFLHALNDPSRPSAGHMTVEQVWALYQEEHVRHKVHDQMRLEYAWRHLKPHFGLFPVEQLVTGHFVTYEVGRREAGAGAGTIRKELSVLQAALTYAAKTGRIRREAIPFFTLPDKPPPRDRWLSAEEIDALVQTAARIRGTGPLTRAERFIHVALATGARRRAIEGLRWSQVDLERRMIDFGAGRGKKRRAVVPISDKLLPVLKQAWNERTTEYVLDMPGSAKDGFNRVAREAGLAGVTPHTLRHTFACHAAMNGVPMADIARVLGNSAAVVETVYAKFRPEYLMKAVNFEPVRLKVVPPKAAEG